MAATRFDLAAGMYIIEARATFQVQWHHTDGGAGRIGGVETGVNDTDPATAAIHLDLLRAATPARRMALAFSLSRSVIDLTRDGIARCLPGASSDEIGLAFVERCYGTELAEGVRADLAARRR